MFQRQANPFVGKPITEENDKLLISWLEERFDKEKLCAIAGVGDYFIFLDFDAFCKASMLVQTKVMEKLKSHV